MATSFKDAVREKGRRFTKAGHQRGMNNAYATLHGQYTGYHSTVVERVAKTKAVDRRPRFLAHLATSLKAWVLEVHKQSEVEIQVMLYDERCFIISCNNDETAAIIVKDLVDKSALEFMKQVASGAEHQGQKTQANDSYRITRHATKLEKELTGKREVNLAALDNLKKDARAVTTTFDASRPIGVEFASFLKTAGNDDAEFIAIVTHSAYEAHAEQKSLIAMLKAAPHIDRTASVIVAGTFRPCRGCFESLSVVKRYAFPNMQFGVRPGHYWRTTERAHMEMLRLLKEVGYISPGQQADDFDRNGVMVGLTNTTHRPSLIAWDKSENEGLHYGTDSESEDEDVKRRVMKRGAPWPASSPKVKPQKL